MSITAAHLLSSAGKAMMELDASGETFAEMWRLWTDWPWPTPCPSAAAFLEVLEEVARGARLGCHDDRFLPRVRHDMLTCASDALSYVLQHELIDV